MHVRSIGRAVAVAGLALLPAGCSEGDKGGGGPRVVPVSGQVIYKGRPVDGATVTFSSPTANVAAYATTGPDGRFAMTTRTPRDGAFPGPQLVAVRKIDILNKGKPGADYASSSEPAPELVVKWLIPERYGDFKTSKLQVTVPDAGTADLTIELKD